MIMSFGRHGVDLDTPRVMGILNVTPDSFYDGGALFKGAKVDLSNAMSRAEEMCSHGASFIDIGGESTRPGAMAVCEQEEMDRVLPVVEIVAKNLDVVISVDTSCAKLMLEAANLGAGLINDVRALTKTGAVEAVALSGLPVCLMHMQGGPRTMQNLPKYRCVLDEVRAFFECRIDACLAGNILRENILLDPGIGFGKTDEHNLTLLKSLDSFKSMGYPLLYGVSRKSIMGRLLGRKPEDRLAGSLAFAYDMLVQGVNIIRVHDVQETMDVVRIFNLLRDN